MGKRGNKLKAEAGASGWEVAAMAAARARSRVYSAQADLAVAEEAARKAELACVRAARAELAGGVTLPEWDLFRGWLVWWWNNGDTSPRGDRPCVRDYADLPAEAVTP